MFVSRLGGASERVVIFFTWGVAGPRPAIRWAPLTGFIGDSYRWVEVVQGWREEGARFG